MIHFASDRNETSWLDEGFAEVAYFLNGYEMDAKPWYVHVRPRPAVDHLGSGQQPATLWTVIPVLSYFPGPLWEGGNPALVKNPENDISSVDHTLTSLGITDPLTGETVTADDVFMDWAAALYLKDGNVGDGRYTYNN
jgi:immune inhibitor A